MLGILCAEAGIYRAGKNSIERASQDYWTVTPRRVATLEAAYAKERPAVGRGAETLGDAAGGGGDSDAAVSR